jgi:hypothetical protein
MTERAKRAAAELERRGWSMDAGMDKECNVCSSQIQIYMNFCPQCGTEVPASFADGTIADLEAALVAAESA